MNVCDLTHIKTIKKDKELNHYDEIQQLEQTYSNKNICLILESVQNQLKTQNIRYLRGLFSGGHDEGGFDEIQFLDENKNIIKQVNLEAHFVEQYSLYKWNNKNLISIFHYSQYIDYDLSKKAEQFLFNTGCLDRFGSFAFEGRVDGTVIFDLIERKLDVSGDEEFHTYENFEETLEFKDGNTTTSCTI